MHFSQLAGTASVAALAVAFVAAPLAAAADDQPPAVARIAVLSGDVVVTRAESGDTLAATVNAPLSDGDSLATASDGRSELQLDDRTDLRVAPATQLRFGTLTTTSNAVELGQGTVELRLWHGAGAHPEIDAGNAIVRPDESGLYRVTVDASGTTFVTARAGTVDVTAGSATQTLEPGSTLEVDGGASETAFRTIAVLAPDDTDQWNDERDRYEQPATSYAYAPLSIVGAEDLDAYGRWVPVAGYGEAWQPTVDPGWAPYHAGRWVWDPYYGWTWLSAEPWGWAPYHYGRWFYANGGWFWTPAVAYAAPVYAPALVTFFSFGGSGASVGVGNVGWVPLGPAEPLYPWWTGDAFRSRVVTNVTNVTNVTTITNVTNVTSVHAPTTIARYRNSHAPGGAVAVDAARFALADFRLAAVAPAALSRARPVRGVVPVVPTEHNLAFAAARSASLRAPRTTTAFARFAGRSRALPVRSFSQQRATVAALAAHAYPHAAALFARSVPAPPNAARSPFVDEVAPSIAPARAGALRGPVPLTRAQSPPAATRPSAHPPLPRPQPLTTLRSTVRTSTPRPAMHAAPLAAPTVHRIATPRGTSPRDERGAGHGDGRERPESWQRQRFPHEKAPAVERAYHR